MKRFVPTIWSLLALVAVAGCDIANKDPFERPMTWQPTGANDANLRAMVANPEDLTSGRGARGSHAILANAAVTRVLTDRVKQLPKVTTSGFGGGGGEAGGGGGGGGNTGLGAAGSGTQQ